mmetsp:Transcript_23491/g.73258  ORF Transcript_23491/g.73258 Transcript_23491/m.73258 type:complete len:637 (+) Transcript_23491:52-1962(+)
MRILRILACANLFDQAQSVDKLLSMSPVSDAIAAIDALRFAPADAQKALQIFAAVPQELKGDKSLREAALYKINQCTHGQDGGGALDVLAMPTAPARKDAAIAAIERSKGDFNVWWLFDAFPEELKGDKHVCEKALAKVAEINRHSDLALMLFNKFTVPARKDVDVQNIMIDLLKIPKNSGCQEEFLEAILDGSKDDADIVLRCCSAWKRFWSVKEVLRKLPDALKADAEFQKQFVHDVDMSPTSDAIATLAAVAPPQRGIGEKVLKIFDRLPESLKRNKRVCEKALVKFLEYDGCNADGAINVFAKFIGPVRKDVDIQDLMIDLLNIPRNTPKQGDFLAEVLDGSKDDAAIALRCCSAWKRLHSVNDVLQKLPDALKADAEFQKQFVHAVAFDGRDDLLRFFPDRRNDVSFCTLLVEKCGVERQTGGMGGRYTDGSSVPKLYRQFSEQVQSDVGLQKVVFERCSAYGMPMLFQFWPQGLQKDPVVRGEFLSKCHDETKAWLYKAFVEALPSEIPSDVDLQRRFIETTGEKYLYKVFDELPEASKSNLDLVYACIDSPKLTDGFWFGLLFEKFPDGVKREPRVHQRCLDRFSREQLRQAFMVQQWPDGKWVPNNNRPDIPDWAKEALQLEPPEAEG